MTIYFNIMIMIMFFMFKKNIIVLYDSKKYVIFYKFTKQRGTKEDKGLGKEFKYNQEINKKTNKL